MLFSFSVLAAAKRGEAGSAFSRSIRVNPCLSVVNVGKSARAFTLVEMLTVIAIIGIVAAFAVPAIKNFGKNDVSVSASRQLLDDIGYARQLAMSQRATVYMVFVPTNFWINPITTANLFTSGTLTVTQMVDATNILDRQLTGYTFMALGAVGDQPGRHQWHFLAPWQNLPQGAYIPLWKFYNPGGKTNAYAFSDPANNNVNFHISPFTYTNFPFPTDPSMDGNTNTEYLPYIAFNYLGQSSDYSGDLLSSANSQEDSDYTGGGIDIPISQGSVIDAIDVNTRMLQPNPPAIVENPPGNTTNISYNVIHIDPLTGRATLEFHKLQ